MLTPLFTEEQTEAQGDCVTHPEAGKACVPFLVNGTHDGVELTLVFYRLVK